MKIYKWRLTISTQNNLCSQRQVPPQAKNTITLGQYDPQKFTPKTQTRNINIGFHNILMLHTLRCRNSCIYVMCSFYDETVFQRKMKSRFFLVGFNLHFIIHSQFFRTHEKSGEKHSGMVGIIFCKKKKKKDTDGMPWIQ